MRRYRIAHMTTLTYSQPIRASHNEIRMTPATEAGQTTLENRIRIRPLTWSHVYRDHWDTHVTSVESLTPHDSLEIEAISTVECVERSDGRDEVASVGWEGVTHPKLVDRTYEWLMVTRHTEPGAELGDLAASARACATPREAASWIGEQIHLTMTFEAGVTGVHSSAEDAWMAKRGVCQDFAHLSIAALRCQGIPARYVSGYLVPTRDGDVGLTAQGESHAWVEFWDGTWLPMDPTNDAPVGPEHIVVARGRDYADVPPFKGVYSGKAQSTQSVVVQFTRLA